MLILQAAVIAMSLSIDAFAASFAYGSNGIKVPMRSLQIINLICSAITGLSLLFGSFLLPYIPAGVTTGISFGILFLLGTIKLLDSITKAIIRRYSRISKEVEFSLFNFRFILNLYADPEKADIDSSKVLSSAEAASLAVALSLDGVAVGFGASLAGINAQAIFLSSFIINMVALSLGVRIGKKVSNDASVNFSWLGGVVLIVMAFTKLF